VEAGFPGVGWSSVAWGHYDNDGDLDSLHTGSTGSAYVSRVYRGDGAPANTPPGTPDGLSSLVAGDEVALSWSISTDAETPAAGLSYNVRIGTTPGGSEIMSPMADPATGYRRVVQLGNVGERASWSVNMPAGTIFWSVQAVDGAYGGSPFAEEQVIYLASVSESPHVPAVFFLGPAIPNPFNPVTEISYGIPASAGPSRVEMNVYDAQGRRVTALVDTDQAPGEYRVVWDGRDHNGTPVASGVYFYRVKWNGKSETRRMVLLK
ncbi:MAG: FlgD immunoglobulin-like domain containing protein, partial [Acidobacteriota bacterium]